MVSGAVQFGGLLPKTAIKKPGREGWNPREMGAASQEPPSTKAESGQLSLALAVLWQSLG